MGKLKLEKNLHYKREEYADYFDVEKQTVYNHTVSELVNEFGTPLHILFEEKLKRNINAYQLVLDRYYDHAQVCCAVKSCWGLPILRTVGSLGCGADVSSKNEMQLALMAGIEKEKLVVNGNAKTDEVLTYCIQNQLRISVDSVYEYQQIEAIAKELDMVAKVLVRVSGFQFQYSTDSCILTSGQWTKFGITMEQFEEEILAKGINEHIDLEGIHVHIGSQLGTYQPYLLVLEKIFEKMVQLKNRGILLKVIDLGGGFPISYVNKTEWEEFCYHVDLKNRSTKDEESFIWGNSPSSYVQDEDFYTDYPKEKMLEKILTSKISFMGEQLLVTDILNKLGKPLLIIEPGRSLAGDAGITISKVNGIKAVMGNNMLVLEMGAVNYSGAVIHNLLNKWDVFGTSKEEKTIQCFITGYLCYNGDMVSRYKIDFPETVKRGDYAITYDTGATECQFFASNANMYPIPTRIMMKKDGTIDVIKRRQQLDEIAQL